MSKGKDPFKFKASRKKHRGRATVVFDLNIRLLTNAAGVVVCTVEWSPGQVNATELMCTK